MEPEGGAAPPGPGPGPDAEAPRMFAGFRALVDLPAVRDKDGGPAGERELGDLLAECGAEVVYGKGGPAPEDVLAAARAGRSVLMVASYANQPAARALRACGAPVVDEIFVDVCLETGRLHPFEGPVLKHMYEPPAAPGAPPGMGGFCVCMTGYTGVERQVLKALIQRTGAAYSGPLKKEQATHLLAYDFAGAKYDMAREWGVPVVNHRWLEDCLRAWRAVPEAGYQALSGRQVEDRGEPRVPLARLTGDAAVADSEDESEGGLVVPCSLGMDVLDAAQQQPDPPRKVSLGLDEPPPGKVPAPAGDPAGDLGGKQAAEDGPGDRHDETSDPSELTKAAGEALGGAAEAPEPAAPEMEEAGREQATPPPVAEAADPEEHMEAPADELAEEPADKPAEEPADEPGDPAMDVAAAVDEEEPGDPVSDEPGDIAPAVDEEEEGAQGGAAEEMVPMEDDTALEEMVPMEDDTALEEKDAEAEEDAALEEKDAEEDEADEAEEAAPSPPPSRPKRRALRERAAPNAAPAPKKPKQKASRAKPASAAAKAPAQVVALSGMHTDEKQRAAGLVRKLGAAGPWQLAHARDLKNHRWHPATSAVVTGKVQRCEKVLAALAAGVPVVTAAWLQAAAEGGAARPPDEAAFYATAAGEHVWAAGAVRHWRERFVGTGRRAFQGLKVVFYGLPAGAHSKPPDLRTWKAVVVAGGGSVVAAKPPYAAGALGEADLAVVGEAKEAGDKWVRAFKAAGVPCVGPDFLRDWLAFPAADLRSHVVFDSSPRGHRHLRIS